MLTYGKAKQTFSLTRNLSSKKFNMENTNQMEIREITASELSDGISSEMPAVTQHGEENSVTPEPVAQPKPQAVEVSRGDTISNPYPQDVNGTFFNPKYHRTDENGKPDFRRGAFVRIGTGRPTKEESEALASKAPKRAPSLRTEYAPPSVDSSSKSKVVLPSGEQPAQPETVNAPSAKAQKKAEKEAQAASGYDLTAETYLQIGYGIAEGFFGPDVRPDDESEHAMLKGPLVALLTEKGEIPLSPTALFLLTLAAYASKKAAKPTVRERATIVFLRFRNWFKAMKG